MAGGQERILRGRIRSIQATKKITRAMELIAASRIVKAQQRVAAAVPYSEKITDVVRDLAAAGAGHRRPVARRSRVDLDDVLRRHHRRSRSVRRLQRRRAAGHRRRSEGRRRQRPAVRHRPDRSQGHRVLPLPRLPARRVVHRILRHAEAGGRQAHRRLRHRAVHQRGGRQGRARVHAVRLRRQPGGRPAPARAAVGGDRGRRRRTSGRSSAIRWSRTARRPGRRLRVRTRPRHDPRLAVAELRRGPGVRRAAQRRGVGARLPAAGDEVRDRQRRGVDQVVEPGDEPGSSGLDHHRDHGDRQWRRGARRRQR